jgi:ATP synthase protein I
VTEPSRGSLPDPSKDPLVPPEPARTVPPRLAAMKAMGGVGTLGLEIALSIVLGLFGGQWLDGRFGTHPWLTLLGSAFGLAAAVRAVMRQMKRMRVEADREEREQGNPDPMWETRDERRRRQAEEKIAAERKGEAS